MPTPLTIQQELEEKVSVVLQALNTLGLMKGVLIQVCPQNDKDVYETKYGTAAHPFWSVSSVLPETFNEQESFNDSDSWLRPVTVVLFSNKASANQFKKEHLYARQQAMRALSKYRFTGNFTSDARSGLLYGKIRPRSVVESSAWLRGSGYISAFDVVFKTLEPRGANP